MGQMLTRVIEEIIAGKSTASADQQMIALGVAKLPEIEKDNTDRNRTSPFAFTGQKFEFRAVGSSQSIAFPIVLLNAAVAQAIGELTDELRGELKGATDQKSIDDAVLRVVRKAFAESTPIRFEGNNYSEEWVEEAARRGLPNFRRSPEALTQLTTQQSHDLLTSLGIFNEEELESRYHVRVERYSKDLLIELNTLHEMVNTAVLPAAFQFLSQLTESAAHAKAAGITAIPQIDAANAVGKLTADLMKERDALLAVITRAEGMHDDVAPQAQLLTSEGAAAMQRVRACCDALEHSVPDALWPIPKYREMLFPV
jgi:glutamine synthetase